MGLRTRACTGLARRPIALLSLPLATEEARRSLKIRPQTPVPAKARQSHVWQAPPAHPPFDQSPRRVQTMDKQTHSFQAEVKQILHLVTHSLYSNKEIFLRELVSNASDACDKLRYEALNENALFEEQPNLEIRVGFDPQARTVTISDNGIGMSAEEAVAHLG